jgi:superfamily II DNA or RNA helicase
MSDNIEKLMNIDYSYPEPSDPNFQKKIYEKREFIYHSIPERPETTNYKDIKEYRDNICGRPFALYEHQAMLSNFINPDTPYKGVVIFHGLGTGKTCAGVAIAEKFKPLVTKYNTKIIILVPGPLLKENWKKSLITCTGETYMKPQDNITYVDDIEKQKEEKNSIIQAMQYYKFMSYKSFYKHVIGEKRTDKTEEGKAIYRKNDEGDFERDFSVDRIYNLNNTVIIVDEAHNLTGNTFGDALKLIIKNSLNLKIVLMSGTPMKNLGSDIVELINFLRPLDNQIERDKIFTSDKGHTMQLKKGGLQYLKNMMKGYISHVRGGDPLIFAQRVDKGKKPKELLFTNVTKCFMLKFQNETYNKAVAENIDDSLDRKSEAVANFVFPGLSSDKKELVGYYANDGLALVKNQLEINGELINKLLSKLLFNNTKEENLLTQSSNNATISGRILKSTYLKYFSIKFYKALKKINRLVCYKKGTQTAFIYSNLVTVGVALFHEVLLQNGYLEYQEESSNYQINDDTVCYYCGKSYHKHKDGSIYLSRSTEESDSEDSEDESSDDEHVEAESKVVISELDISDSSSEYEKKSSKIPKHAFYPATFITITGQSNEDSLESLPEDKKRILDRAFNIVENKEGKYLKFVLGSRVMNEGISLRQVGEVHILDAYFNFARIDQVVGRGIRNCSHYKLMSEDNVYPKVNVYKYVISLENGNMSTEEELYQKAELKYMLIKKIERAMKEVAIDCPLNLNGNMFKEEIEKYKDCEPEKNCPAVCDYNKCNYICDGELLNTEYYDPNRQIYTKIPKDKLDYTTFTEGLAKTEIDNARERIKEMYISNYMYTLNEIIEYVKNSYSESKNDLFDEFFVYKALDSLIPFTENDFNNFKDSIIDKYNRQGYLIYINKYYIFQPFDQNENVPMYYRTTVTQHITQELSLYNYLKNSPMYKELKKTKDKIEEDVDTSFYDFDTAMEYYDSRDSGEFHYVGIIDKDIGRNKSKSNEQIPDAFKIREKRPKILSKLRASGVVSLLGSMCVFRSKTYLRDVIKKIGLVTTLKNRSDLCNAIRDKMLLLEKYGTTKEKNKYTYVIVPSNHKILPFPYNLEDRADFIVDKIKKKIGNKINISVKTKIKTSGEEKGHLSYIITVTDDAKLKDHIDFLKKLGLVKEKDNWAINLD